MSQQPLELILARQFADSMTMAVFLVDPEGNLLFYNEAAEDILGIRFSETGIMPVGEWSSIFKPTDFDDNPIPPSELPLVETLNTQRPAHGTFYINNKKEKHVSITVTSIPIEGRPDRYIGAMALFWKSPES